MLFSSPQGVAAHGPGAWWFSLSSSALGREVSSEGLLLSWEESLEEPLPVPEELLSWEEEESSSLEEPSS